jgi:teichuronic acid biosynthesis glycosyltransferase TuaC
LRLAILTTSYPQHGSDPSGHFVETEAALLASDGHEVHVVAPGASAPPAGKEPCSTLAADGHPTVWRVGARRLFGFPGALPRLRENPLRALELAWFIPRVRSRLASIGAVAPIDRVIADFLVPCGYPLALGVAKSFDIVLHGSDVRLVLRLPRFVRRHIARSLLSARATFRFVSEDLCSRFLAGLPAPERDAVQKVSRVELPHVTVPSLIARLSPGSSLAELSSNSSGGRRRLKGVGECWVVCARLIAPKRVDRAIRVAAERDVHLTVIGDGPLGSELRALAASLGGAVDFVGQLPRDQALAHIAVADRLVHLSDAEGCPTVVREARALGVPVLASAVGDLVKWAAADPGIEIHWDGSGVLPWS